MPALANEGPDHLTNAYVTEKASEEKAIDAITGAPSSWNVLANIAIEQPNSDRRLQVSVLFNVADIVECVYLTKVDQKIQRLWF